MSSWKLCINKPLTFDQRQLKALEVCEERVGLFLTGNGWGGGVQKDQMTGDGPYLENDYSDSSGRGWGDGGDGLGAGYDVQPLGEHILMNWGGDGGSPEVW